MWKFHNCITYGVNFVILCHSANSNGARTVYLVELSPDIIPNFDFSRERAIVE